MPAPLLRFATIEDAPVVARLLREMDGHYHPDGPLRTPEAYLSTVRSVIDSDEGTRFALCFLDPDEASSAAGIACVGVLRPGQALQGLVFVKDLFVRDGTRDRGVGAALMRFLARFAVESGIGRIDLTTDAENLGAQRLYERLGAVVRPKVCYSFPTEVLRHLAEE